MITMIRPSENARVTNLDDITSIRYSYGNQDGYVVDKGLELSQTINGQNFVINSGRVVLQGVESDIDANGVSLFIEAVAQTRYYVAYYNVNMATNSVSIEATYSTSSYPDVPYGDDFNQVSNGVSKLPLYRFTATNGVISNVQKVVKPIKYLDKTFYEFEKGADGVLTDGKQKISTLVLLMDTGQTGMGNQVTDVSYDMPSELTINDTIMMELGTGDIVMFRPSNNTSETSYTYRYTRVQLGGDSDIMVATTGYVFDFSSRKITIPTSQSRYRYINSASTWGNWSKPNISKLWKVVN